MELLPKTGMPAKKVTGQTFKHWFLAYTGSTGSTVTLSSPSQDSLANESVIPMKVSVE